MAAERNLGEAWKRLALHMARLALAGRDADQRLVREQDIVQLPELRGKHPYDLRHAAVSTWLSSGVEPQLVAERAGHSVAVLFRVYAKFLKDGDETANAKISARLGQRG